MLHFFVGGGGCLICLIVMVVKLLTGFEAFCPPVKDYALAVSVVILDGASVVQILKGTKGLALFSARIFAHATEAAKMPSKKISSCAVDTDVVVLVIPVVLQF